MARDCTKTGMRNMEMHEASLQNLEGHEGQLEQGNAGQASRVIDPNTLNQRLTQAKDREGLPSIDRVAFNPSSQDTQKTSSMQMPTKGEGLNAVTPYHSAGRAQWKSSINEKQEQRESSFKSRHDVQVRYAPNV